MSRQFQKNKTVNAGVQALVALQNSLQQTIHALVKLKIRDSFLEALRFLLDEVTFCINRAKVQANAADVFEKYNKLISDLQELIQGHFDSCSMNLSIQLPIFLENFKQAELAMMFQSSALYPFRVEALLRRETVEHGDMFDAEEVHVSLGLKLLRLLAHDQFKQNEAIRLRLLRMIELHPTQNFDIREIFDAIKEGSAQAWQVCIVLLFNHKQFSPKQSDDLSADVKRAVTELVNKEKANNIELPSVQILHEALRHDARGEIFTAILQNYILQPHFTGDEIMSVLELIAPEPRAQLAELIILQDQERQRGFIAFMRSYFSRNAHYQSELFTAEQLSQLFDYKGRAASTPILPTSIQVNAALRQKGIFGHVPASSSAVLVVEEQEQVMGASSLKKRD